MLMSRYDSVLSKLDELSKELKDITNDADNSLDRETPMEVIKNICPKCSTFQWEVENYCAHCGQKLIKHNVHKRG